MAPGRSVGRMTKWVKMGIAGAALVAGAIALSTESDCDILRASYERGLERPAQVMHGTHGSVVIAPDGAIGVSLLEDEMQAMDCG